ncbi:hypothetical protein AtEden1_Chr1g0048051 [Arabidopsis thaliana]
MTHLYKSPFCSLLIFHVYLYSLFSIRVTKFKRKEKKEKKMAKATSSLVVPIIFLVIFALVEQNTCLKYYPVTRKAICRKNHCVCIGPCPNDKAIPNVKLFKNVKEQILS